MNHDANRNMNDDQERGFLGHGYSVSADSFTQLFRYPDLGHLFYHGYLDLSVDTFMYLYQRKSRKLS